MKGSRRQSFLEVGQDLEGGEGKGKRKRLSVLESGEGRGTFQAVGPKGISPQGHELSRCHLDLWNFHNTWLCPVGGHLQHPRHGKKDFLILSSTCSHSGVGLPMVTWKGNTDYFITHYFECLLYAFPGGFPGLGVRAEKRNHLP